MGVLEPAGLVASKERRLIIIAVALSMIVVVPVFGMTIAIIWKYRAGNPKATYHPDWDNSRLAETIWWGVPTLIILVLSVLTWQSSHELDPYRALASDTKPLTVQVIALQWKWLFLYPDQHIASVNYLQLPVHTPINFEVTSDAPMNSFWIPQLGGQIYAMTGMSTQLHLVADKLGSYMGVSANISGTGFAGMHFTAVASSQADFDQWAKHAQSSSEKMTAATYAALAKPTQNVPPASYALSDKDLYNAVIMKYMGPMTQDTGKTAIPPTTSDMAVPDASNKTMSGMDMSGMAM